MVRSVALGTMVLMCFAQPSGAQQTRAVAGQFGILGEWDLTATLARQPGGQWVGPARMKHVGYCTVDGPEEKTGELQLTLAEARGRISGTILIDGVPCAFSARLKDGYEGNLRCPDRRDVPMTLSVD
jgi:hypothetical protein